MQALCPVRGQMVPWIDISELLNYASDPAHSIIDKNEVWYRNNQLSHLINPREMLGFLSFFILCHAYTLSSSNMLHSSSLIVILLHYVEGLTLEDLCVLCF